MYDAHQQPVMYDAALMPKVRYLASLCTNNVIIHPIYLLTGNSNDSRFIYFLHVPQQHLPALAPSLLSPLCEGALSLLLLSFIYSLALLSFTLCMNLSIFYSSPVIRRSRYRVADGAFSPLSHLANLFFRPPACSPLYLCTL